MFMRAHTVARCYMNQTAQMVDINTDNVLYVSEHDNLLEFMFVNGLSLLVDKLYRKDGTEVSVTVSKIEKEV